MERLKSKVEAQSSDVRNGTRLCYVDCVNYMTYIVVDVDKDSFECINEETKEQEVYFFNELQHGWDFL